MDLHRLRPADWLTGACGLALLLLLFAPWYTVSDGSLNAWAAFALLDLWLLLTGLLALGVVAATASRDSPSIPVAMDVVCWAASLIALLLVVVRLLAEPQADVVTGRDWGAFAGSAAVLGVFAASFWAMRDEAAPGIRQPAEVPTMQAPPPGTGPEPVKAET